MSLLTSGSGEPIGITSFLSILPGATQACLDRDSDIDGNSSKCEMPRICGIC